LLARYDVNAYITGHDHDMEHLQDNDYENLHYIVSGAGSKVGIACRGADAACRAHRAGGRLLVFPPRAVSHPLHVYIGPRCSPRPSMTRGLLMATGISPACSTLGATLGMQRFRFQPRRFSLSSSTTRGTTSTGRVFPIPPRAGNRLERHTLCRQSQRKQGNVCTMGQSQVSPTCKAQMRESAEERDVLCSTRQSTSRLVFLLLTTLV
jgi:hypothetical protein